MDLETHHEGDVDSIWRMVESVPLQEDADPLLQQTISGVTLVRQLGEGGMGRVYEGIQGNSSRRVAVKVLRPGLISRESLKRFLREFEILSQLQHPQISQVYSAGTLRLAGVSLPFFVMELVADARTITRYVADAGLSQRQTLELFYLVCTAVAYGHAMGVVHRDLKPSNVLVDGDGNPKVIDFGVARAGEGPQASTAITEAGQLIGTLQYMSPEQLATGGVTADYRADVYSLGLIAYELLAGEPPYSIAEKPLMQTIQILEEHRPEPLRKVNPAVPQPVADLVKTCLEKDRGRRFADAGELAAALRNHLEGLPVRSFWQRVAAWRSATCSKKRMREVGLVLIIVVGIPLATWLNSRPAAFRSRWQSLGSTVAPGLLVSVPSRVPFTNEPALYEATSRGFRYGFRHINQPGAERFLVTATGMKKWRDTFMNPPVTYWAPAANAEVGTLVYRIDFPKRTKKVELRAAAACWDFSRQPGGTGRGVASLELSADGKEWATLFDSITSRQWGEGWQLDEKISSAFCGRKVLWIRMKFLSEAAPISSGYNVTQFARATAGDPRNVFEVRATFRD